MLYLKLHIFHISLVPKKRDKGYLGLNGNRKKNVFKWLGKKLLREKWSNNNVLHLVTFVGLTKTIKVLSVDTIETNWTEKNANRNNIWALLGGVFITHATVSNQFFVIFFFLQKVLPLVLFLSEKNNEIKYKKFFQNFWYFVQKK